MFSRRTSKPKHSVDLSFLNCEEMSAILKVLERDKEVQRINNERLKEIKKASQDKSWLKGVTGQWFEEIRKAKFKDQTDLTRILKVPHTWSLRKKNRTALSDLKLPPSKSCRQSKNHIEFSGDSRGEDSLDPVSRPTAFSESANQNTESYSEQIQCSNYNSLQLESSNMFPQLQVQLKTAVVPQVERKIHVYRDFGKQIHSELLSQDLETKTISVVVDEHKKILGTEDLSNSELQRNITNEEGAKSYNRLAKQYRNENETNAVLNSSELSENAELQSLPVWCSIGNVRQTPSTRNLHAVQRQGNVYASVETGQYKTDNAISPNSASGPWSSVTEPKKMFENHPINCTDDILRTNTDGCLSNSKHETARTSLLDLQTKSLSVVSNSNRNGQQSYSSNNICVPSQRDESYSQSNSEPSSLSSITGPSLNIGNRDVLQQNLSNSSLNISQKNDTAAYLNDSKSKSIPPISSSVPAHTSHTPLFTIYTDSRRNIHSQSCNNTIFQRGSSNDSLQTSKHKPISSLSLSEPVYQPRASSFITMSSKNRWQYSGTDNINIATQSTCNDDHLQSSWDGRERTTLFTYIEGEKSSNNLRLSETRMEPVTLRDADGPLPESENNSWKYNCENDGKSTSSLATELICSQLPTHVNTCIDSNVLQTNRTSAALKSGGNNCLQKIKRETGHELAVDPKPVPKCVTNIIHYNSALLSDHLKTDDVSFESVSNDSLQNGESETSYAVETAITQSPNNAYKIFASQSLSSTSNALNLDINSKQNCRQAIGIKPSTDQVLSYKFPICPSYKYHLLNDSTKSTDITSDRTGNEHKSDPNCALPLSDSKEASPSDTKNNMKNTLQNWPVHTISNNLPEIHSVHDAQNYKSEKTSTPSSVVFKQCLSTNTNKGKSSKNYPNRRNNKKAQKNISETVNEKQSSTNITSHLNQNTLLTYSSLNRGNEYLPMDKSDTNSKLSAQDSLSGQKPLTNFRDSQDKSLPYFPLSGKTTMNPGTINNAENYQSEENIPISPHDAMSYQQSLTNSHRNMDKLLIHSPVKPGVIKNLENDQTENYKVVLLLDTATDLKTPSDIIYDTKSTFQNWEQNGADTTMRGITKDYKEPDIPKIDIALSVLDPVFNQLSLIDNTHCNDHKPLCHSLSSANVTWKRKHLGCSKNCESETHSTVVSNKGTHQLSPINTTYNKDKQLNYLPDSAEIKREVKGLAEQDETKATNPPSSLGPVIRQPSPVNITHKNRYESPNCSFNNSPLIVDTEINKHLQKDDPEISGVDPSADSLHSTAVEYLQESPTAITEKRKNGLQKYSSITDICCDEGPCDQYKSKCLGKTNNAFSSLPGMTSPWLSSSIIHNNQNKPLIHSLLSSDIYVDREGNQLNKSESQVADPPLELLTILQFSTTSRDIKKGALHIDSAKVNEIAHDEKSCDKNVENYQSEHHGRISPGRATGQRNPTNITPGGENTQQNLPSINDDITLDRRLNKDNVQQNNSETIQISSAADSVIGQQVSTNIPHRSKYQLLNYSPNCPAVIVDRGGNKYLQKDNTGPILPDSLSEQPSPTNTHNKVKPLTHFPISDDNNLSAEVTKNAENYQSEENSSIPSPGALIDQKSLTNSHSNLGKPLTHSLESGDIDINKNLQKHKPEISCVTSPVYPFNTHHSAANVTNVKKNTLQHYITKVTDIYHRKRPSGKFKLNALHKTESAPSPSSAVTSQWLPENISQSSSQDKSKALLLVRDDTSLLVNSKNIENYQSDKSSAVTSADKLNGQWAHKNITQGRKNTLQNYSLNIDGITVDREVNNTCDVVDTFETKYGPSALNQVSSQLSPTDIAHSNEHKPLSHLLNSAAVTVYGESPDYLEKCKAETKSVLLSGDEVAQQKSPTSTTYSYKDKPLSHSSVMTDVSAINQDYNQDKFKTSHILAALDSVTRHHSSKNITQISKCKTLSYSLNCATVTTDTGVNEHLKKDSPETNKIPAVDSLSEIQSTTTLTDIKKGALLNGPSMVTEIAHAKKSFCVLTFEISDETNSAPSSPPPVTSQCFPTILSYNNKSYSQSHSPLSGDTTMDRGCVEYLQKENSDLSTPDSLTDQQFPTNSTCDGMNKSPTHSLLMGGIFVAPGSVNNLENYQSEHHGRISPGRVASQRNPTNITPGGENTQQNLPSINDDITLDRRLNKDNVQQNNSETIQISSAADSVIGQQVSTNIPHRSKYQLLNYSPNCPAVIVDRGGNKYLQKENTGPILPDSLSEQPSPTNTHNKVKPLTHFPISDDNNLSAEVTKNAESYQTEENSSIPSPGALIDQKSLDNSHSNLGKPLTHSLESGDIDINKNLQKHKPKISCVTSPVYPFNTQRSAVSLTNVKKNTLQHYITKVTDIYHRKRPSGKFKLNLHKAKSAPSPSSAVTSQWLPENISQSSSQDKSKALSLVRDDISLLANSKNIENYRSDKSSAVTSADKLNGQWAHKNITQGRKNTLQNYSLNIDGITVDREVNNTCDVVDTFETKYRPSALNQVSSQLSPTDIAHSNEHKPLSHLLNSAAVTVYQESPDYLEKCKHETKSVLLSGDKVAQQKSPTSTTYSYKDKPLSHSSVTTDVSAMNQDYNQDKFKTSHILAALDPVTRHHSSKNMTHSSKCKTLSYSLNCATVTADTGVNEHLKKDSPETNKIPAVDSLSDRQSTTTDIKKNTRQNYSSHRSETYQDKIPYKRLKFKDLHKTNNAPSSPPKVTEQWLTTNITHNNQDKSSTHSTLSGEFIMNRRNNSYLQKFNSGTNNEFSFSTSLAEQQSPLNIIKSKQAKSLAHSPNRSGFIMDSAVSRNLQNDQPESNRKAFLWPDTDIACGKNTKFQNWFPTSNMSLSLQRGDNMKHYKSETDITVSSLDLLIDQESFMDITCSKKSKYSRQSTKSRGTPPARGFYGSCEQINKDSINNISSSHDLSPTLLSPANIVHNNRNVMCDHSSISADLSAQDRENAKKDGKIFRCKRKSFGGEMVQNQTFGTWMKNTNGYNTLQQSSPEENQIDSDITEINNFRNRLNAYSDFSQYRASSSSIDEDDTENNNYQAGTARFSKNYFRFTRSLRANPQDIQNRCGNMYKAKSLKDINSDYNQSSLQDHEHLFSTNSLHNSKLTVRNRQVHPSLQFSNRIKSSRLYRSYSDLPFSNRNESDSHNWTSYHGSKFSELVIGNDDTRNVSKEEKRKETHLENLNRVLVVDRLWKPGYLHKEASSLRSEDIFNPCTSGVNQDPGVNDDPEQNDEYFPVDIKIFWPKENPTDIIRLLSSSSTGSKISEDSLSPQHHRTPAVFGKQNLSSYSDTNSDTTTDDEYFLDGNETVKESAL
ncbi:uncharacterized protein LOC121284039 [Carcharodon carcharias]|uniref:uncharacterized protein LOC121284039 n=1 Tax=Carcharodon carcharias TaxID=13397 RepID=UPI001B7E55E8|nr:uncharacterized protein LOC121284039 [Carcharodon carcharias]